MLKCPLVMIARAGSFALVAGCTEDLALGPKGSAHVIQVVSVVAAPLETECAKTDVPILIDVRMVNTTAERVTLTKVSSAGVVLDGANNRPALSFANLEFTPIVLRSADGDATTRVTMPVSCAASGMIRLQLYMTTTAGQFATPVFTVVLTLS